MTKRDWLIILAITLLAAGLRFYQLGVIPPGPQFDEAYNGIDTEQVMAGNRPLFLPANAGREVVYTYLQAGLGELFGLDLRTLRLASALAGLLTVPALYLLVRRLFRRNSQWLAATTAAALAVSYWHIHFSHYGIRVILMPLILCGVFGSFWLGMEAGSRRARLWALAIGGALAGLGVWTNPTGRFVPFVVVPYAAWLWWHHPERRRLRWDGPIGGTLIFGAAALLVFLPLGVEFWRHPEFFTGHASEVSVFAGRVSGQTSPWLLLGTNALRVLGMFSFDGDLEWAHGIAGRPVMDWFIAIPFYLGVVLWGLRLLGRGRVKGDPDRDALALFFLWALVMLAPSILSEAAPNYSRTLPAIPPVMLAVGLGLTWLATAARLQPRLGPALAVGLLAVSLAVTSYDYFVRFPAYRAVYYAYDADKVDAIDWLTQQAGANTVYLSPLWSTHATVTFLAADKVKSIDTTSALALPAADKGAVYAYPAEETAAAADTAKIWGATVQQLADRYGQPLLNVVSVDAGRAAQWPLKLTPGVTTTARFDDAPGLVGMKSGKTGLWLFWQAEQPTVRDLTSFVHLIDGQGRRVGQADVVPGDGFYRTPAWSPGERVIQRYAPEISDACAGGEPVSVVAGWYEYAAGGQRRPRLEATGDTALAGTYTVPLVAHPADQMQPSTRADLDFGAGLRLVGYSLDTAAAEPGAPLAVDLFWAGSATQASRPVTLTVAPTVAPTAAVGGAPVTLWSGVLAPEAVWPEGEVICRRLHVRLPPGIPAGDAVLTLATAGASQPLGTLTVQPSTRRFDLPALTHAVDAGVGGQIKLAGYDAAAAGGALTVTLVWQAQAAPAFDGKVFVHLLDPAGQIVSQADAFPAGDRHTLAWAPGEVVVDVHTLPLPAGLPAGEYRLRTGVYEPVSGQRLAATRQDGSRFSDDAIDLGSVRLP